MRAFLGRGFLGDRLMIMKSASALEHVQNTADLAQEFVEDQGKRKPVVKNLDACVFCTGCEEQCPAGAIKHPSKEETEKIINKLKKNSNVSQKRN